MPAFETEKLVRIQHCDPAGVVFTPQYFNLFVEVLEDWYEQLGSGFADVIGGGSGLPAMKILARFVKPSRMGERLTFRLSVKRVRTRTIELRITADCGTTKRVEMQFVIGHASIEAFRLTNWPATMRARMSAYAE